MDTPKILVVEDDQDINAIVAEKLRRAGYACDQAFSGTEAALMLSSAGVNVAAAGEGAASGQGAASGACSYALVICDLMLPGMAGEELVRRVRASAAEVPIIVISARTGVNDRIDLLRLGADDYLVKPFDLGELVARVEVQLRRHAVSVPQGSTRRYGRWELNAEEHTFAVDGVPVSLTRAEFDVVAALMARPSKVFTKGELFELVWGEPAPTGDNSMAVHVSNIRAKLRPSGTEGYIKTVWGLGFKLAEL